LTSVFFEFCKLTPTGFTHKVVHVIGIALLS